MTQVISDSNTALIQKLKLLRPNIVNKFDNGRSEVHREEDFAEAVQKVQEGLRTLFDVVGDNSAREGLIDSPDRIIKAFVEMTAGLDEDAKQILSTSFALEDELGQASQYSQIILSRHIPFNSLCEHHWLPFTGVAHVGYIPGDHGRVVGLSKLARVVDAYARRPQVQEKMTQQIADILQEELNPRGVAVMIKGQHSCQCLRGVKKDGYMVTSALHGVFLTDASAKAELIELIKL